MSFKRTVAAAAVTIMLAAGSATAATYKAFSHYEGGQPEHSVWFSGGSNPSGSTGSKPNHFTFENALPGHGVFAVNGNTATLTGNVRNAAGEGFYVELYLSEVGDPGTYKDAPGYAGDRSDWRFFELDAGQTSMLTALAGSEALGSYDMTLRGDPLKVQFGIGANDKDPTLLGLSTWIDFTEKAGTCAQTGCRSYAGDINITLSQVPVPAALPLLAAGIGGLGFVGRRRRSKR